MQTGAPRVARRGCECPLPSTAPSPLPSQPTASAFAYLQSPAPVRAPSSRDLRLQTEAVQDPRLARWPPSRLLGAVRRAPSAGARVSGAEGATAPLPARFLSGWFQPARGQNTRARGQLGERAWLPGPPAPGTGALLSEQRSSSA